VQAGKYSNAYTGDWCFGDLKHFGMQATAKEYQNFAIYNRRKQTDGDEICNLANVIQRTLFGQITIA
jgi:hypothetical protein